MKPEEKTRKKANSALRFSGIGMQMLATILIFYYIGMSIDTRSDPGGANWTLILTLTGVCVALYFMIKGLLNLTR